MPVYAIVLHASCGTAAGDVPTLRGEDSTHLVSSHYYVKKDGTIDHFVADADVAFHAGVVDQPDHSNEATIGIETENPNDGSGWTEAIVQSVANLVAALRQQYGKPLPVLSHAQIARPVGRKTDPLGFPWNDLSAKAKEASTYKWMLKQVN